MKNIIIVGDSFCACDAGWPGTLSKMLNLELINYGCSGEHWWGVTNFLNNLPQETLDNCEVIIFAHTEARRIPNTSNKKLNKVHPPETEQELKLAIELYFKYMHEDEFLDWVQIQWFKEVSNNWQHIKLINLHSFPTSLSQRHHLKGVNILPDLLSISLTESGIDHNTMMFDMRLNHLNVNNNLIMANQLYDIILNYYPGDIKLDLLQFKSD